MNSANGKGLVLLSGGLDSMVLAHSVAAEHWLGRTVFIRHGKRRNSPELRAARVLAASLQVPLDVADLSGIRKVSVGYHPEIPTSLDEEPPTANIIDGDGIPAESLLMKKGLSPFSVMLTAALYYAHVVDASSLHIGLIGLQAADRPGFKSYLDGLSALDHQLNPRLPRVRIEAPFMEMEKAEVVRLGQKLKVPFAKSWSCLRWGDAHCGTCAHCKQRQEAFAAAGIDDPTTYLDAPQLSPRVDSSLSDSVQRQIAT
jgi:7-cyano-7-deazaguanine synthase